MIKFHDIMMLKIFYVKIYRAQRNQNIALKAAYKSPIMDKLTFSLYESWTYPHSCF